MWRVNQQSAANATAECEGCTLLQYRRHCWDGA